MLIEISIGLGLSYSILFLLSIILKDNSIVDIFWGLGFIQVTFHSLYLSNQTTLTQILLLILIILWALRLSGYVTYKRIKRKSEDPRYEAWRKQWKFFYIRSFFQVYILQAILLLIISTPIILFNSNPQQFSLLIIIGIIISMIGLLYETISDIQLFKFISNKKNKGKIMQKGLWKYSRHPNYFGESTFWLGISLIGLSSSIYSIIGYLTITFLLRFISGVPMAEKNYKNRKEFIEYSKKTPAFFPNFFVK